MKAVLDYYELASDVAEVNINGSFLPVNRRYRYTSERLNNVNLGGTAGIKPLVPYRDEGLFVF